jgi:hypothetical protein
MLSTQATQRILRSNLHVNSDLQHRGRLLGPRRPLPLRGLTDCLTVAPAGEDIRQLIFFPDGHLRYDWQYQGSALAVRAAQLPDLHFDQTEEEFDDSILH